MWPGRLELLRVRDRDVLLDGAHNPAGAAALAVALDDLRPFLADGPITLVTASMADKDVDGVIARARGGRMRWPTRRSSARAWMSRARWPPTTSRRAGGPDVPRRRRRGPSPIADPIAALDHALAAGGPVVVAGSLYLVGAARGHLLDDPALHDPIEDA